VTYEYECAECGRRFDVIKSVKDMERNENCPKCGEFGIRKCIPSKVYFNQTEVTHAEYNPGLGAVVKNKRHKDYLMKSKGIVEVGNDFGNGEKMQKEFDTAREEKLKKSWDDV
jgi:putative FmdB family regulatory protein